MIEVMNNINIDIYIDSLTSQSLSLSFSLTQRVDCTGTVLYTNLLKSLTFLLGALGKIPCPWIGFASGEQIIAGDEWLSNVKASKTAHDFLSRRKLHGAKSVPANLQYLTKF